MATQVDSQSDGRVYSIRFNGREVALLARIADQQSMRISEILHDALAHYLTSQRRPTVEVLAPEHAKIFMYRGEPAPNQTTNPTKVIDHSD